MQIESRKSPQGLFRLCFSLCLDDAHFSKFFCSMFQRISSWQEISERNRKLNYVTQFYFIFVTCTIIVSGEFLFPPENTKNPENLNMKWIVMNSLGGIFIFVHLSNIYTEININNRVVPGKRVRAVIESKTFTGLIFTHWWFLPRKDFDEADTIAQ